MDDCEKTYEVEQERLEGENQKLLALFETELNQTLAPRTVRRHVQNVDAYINGYLLFQEPPVPAAGGNETA